jgi:hypothetical protein
VNNAVGWLLAALLLVACGGGDDSNGSNNDNTGDGGPPGSGPSFGGEAGTPSPAKPAVDRVVLGGDAACAQLSDRSVCCWGANDRGQLGDGSTTPTAVGVAVKALGQDVSAVFAGGGGWGGAGFSSGNQDFCARGGDGKVSCWGANSDDDYGKYGDPCGYWGGDLGMVHLPLPAGMPVVTPQKIDPLSGATQIVFGGEAAFALAADGSVVGWGFGGPYTLGSGQTTETRTPVALAPLGNGVAQLAAGDLSACALMKDGSVKCWGGWDYAPMGLGWPPEPIPLAGPATQIAMSSGIGYAQGWGCQGCGALLGWDGSSTCALMKDGTVSCWGQNLENIQGQGPVLQTPTLVPNLVHVTRIGMGTQRGCALEEDGTVWCWGWPIDTPQDWNDWQSCVGWVTVFVQTVQPPTQVTGIPPATDLVVGPDAACAHGRDGTWWCWGDAMPGLPAHVVQPIELPDSLDCDTGSTPQASK